MFTPNIDRLVREGIFFERAYCQQAVCGPSKASFVTGLNLETLGMTKNLIHFRNTSPKVVTMPRYDKQNDYHTFSIENVFHDRENSSWSAPD